MIPSLILLSAGTFQLGLNSLFVDATEAERGLFHVTETLAVKPGKLDLCYPKWIPGEHSPTGPLNSVINFQVFVGTKRLEWIRDPVELFTVHLNVPSGASTVIVKFDQISTGGAFGITSSAKLARLKWNRLLWYPFGPSDVRDPCGVFHFWSLHPGGAGFVFADGSYHFLKYAAADILPALATRAGGEVVALPD